MNTKSHSIWKAYGYAWVTLGFFLISLPPEPGQSASTVPEISGRIVFD